MDGELRFCLLNEAFKNKDGVVVSRIDLDKDYWPTPLETRMELKDRFLSEDESLVWIMGGDRFDWIFKNTPKLIDSILKDDYLMIFPRAPYNFSMLINNEYLSKMVDHSRLWISDDIVSNISSSQIRKLEGCV